MENRRSVLLIGSAGYIGSVVTRYFLNNGYIVRGFDKILYHNNSTVLPFLNDENYEFHYGDLTCQSDVNKALEGITDVIILAGLVGDPITKKYPNESDYINNIGLKYFVDSLNNRDLNRVVFISTCSNYGLIPENVLADEEYELKPLSLYAKAKVELETYLLSLKGKIDYTPTILRFATAFGVSPRMRFDLSVNEFVREMYLGADLVVYDHDTWRPYCHVLDFSQALMKVIEAPQSDVAFQVFNAGSEKNNYTKKMIIDEIVGFTPNAKITYQKHGTDPRNYRVDFSKIRETLGFEAEYTIYDGIKEIINGLENKLFDDVEARRNFYGNYHLDYQITTTTKEAVS